MSIVLYVIGGIVVLWTAAYIFKRVRRARAVKRFLASNPSAKETFERTVLYDLRSTRTETVATKDGKRELLVLQFGGGQQLGIDAEGKRHALCGGKWLNA